MIVLSLLWFVAFADLPLDGDTSATQVAIYVSTTGDDANSGLAPDVPIATLARAQEVIEERFASDEDVGDMEVRIASGVYRGQSVRWRVTTPDRAIRFVAWAGQDGEPAVFEGRGRGSWFILTHDRGERTNLEFRGLTVRKYATAISLNGNRNRVDACNRGNRIVGCTFETIGEGSTAAVRLVNSKENEIIDNVFRDIVRSERCGLLHAIYAAHHASGNRIERNRFEKCCGDPVRVRDGSNDNRINRNTFVRSGIAAAYSDWYCDHDARDDCTKSTPECPSWDNEFQHNTLGTTFSGHPLPAVKLFQGDTTTGCQRPTPESVRVRQTGNQRAE